MARVKDTGYVNPQEVYNYLVNVKGLSREHALGMLSNIQAESGFKIAVQEYGKPQGTGGIGLFQHTGPRRQALVKYTGGDVNDWTKQVDFALQEGVTKTYLSQKFETPEEASIWFTTKWERPANANQRAQERLKYLNNYSNFSGYESTYQPSSSSSSQGAGQNAQQGVAQMPIPFEVVIAGKPQQVAFSYEDFQKALATTQKEEEKEQESEARQELKQEMTTQEAFLKAMESISLPSPSSRGNQQQQFAAADTTGYEPLPIQEVSTSLPQLPNIFSTKLPEMQEGGPLVIGETYYYPGRPGSSYQINDNGQWTIKNSSTAGKYVPIKDPTGQRAETLERYALDSGAYQEYINKAKKQVSNPTSTLKINDPRTIRATTNQAIRPNVDLMSGTYNKEVITNIVSRAKTLGIDPATALAVAYQESQFGKTDPNLGHMSEAFEGSQDPYMYLNVLKNKMQSAQKAGYNDELYQLQYYNGMGKLFPGTESSYHGYQAGKFYGVPVPASGLDLSKNPLYGKQIIDLRDNVLLKNPEVVNIIKNTPTGKGFREGGKKVSPQDTKEMLDGVADILRQVVNVNNRKAIAKNMIEDFNREGLDYDLNNFLRSSRVKMQEGGSYTDWPDLPPIVSKAFEKGSLQLSPIYAESRGSAIKPQYRVAFTTGDVNSKKAGWSFTGGIGKEYDPNIPTDIQGVIDTYNQPGDITRGLMKSLLPNPEKVNSGLAYNFEANYEGKKGISGQRFTPLVQIGINSSPSTGKGLYVTGGGQFDFGKNNYRNGQIRDGYAAGSAGPYAGWAAGTSQFGPVLGAQGQFDYRPRFFGEMPGMISGKFNIGVNPLNSSGASGPVVYGGELGLKIPVSKINAPNINMPNINLSPLTSFLGRANRPDEGGMGAPQDMGTGWGDAGAVNASPVGKQNNPEMGGIYIPSNSNPGEEPILYDPNNPEGYNNNQYLRGGLVKTFTLF